jgi:hypothetical protein
LNAATRRGLYRGKFVASKSEVVVTCTQLTRDASELDNLTWLRLYVTGNTFGR